MQLDCPADRQVVRAEADEVDDGTDNIKEKRGRDGIPHEADDEGDEPNRTDELQPDPSADLDPRQCVAVPP